MIEKDKYKTYAFYGPLAELCKKFVEEKRAVGYIYNTESKKLSAFTKETLKYETQPNVLTETMVNAYMKRKPNESDRNYYSRFAIVKLFANFMLRLGLKAYCPSKEDVGKINWNYKPYIFTHEEIARFFKAADSMTCKSHSISPRRHIMMPLIFRLLYCCGLRISEALKLKVSEVDLSNGVLTIRETKFGKTRYVSMSEDLVQLLTNYYNSYVLSYSLTKYLFSANDDGQYDPRTIYSVFRELLWQANISHGGKNNGPRMHDFRHTFAVHCLEKWIATGKNLSTALPYLTAYLGHESFACTEKYLRMTAEVFPYITKTLQLKYGNIIPKMEETK